MEQERSLVKIIMVLFLFLCETRQVTNTQALAALLAAATTLHQTYLHDIEERLSISVFNEQGA